MLEKIIKLTNAASSGTFGSFVGHCPIHNDKNKSLSITQKDGKLLLHCHAGCSQDELIDLLKRNGAWAESENRKVNETQTNALALWNSSQGISNAGQAGKYLKHRGFDLETFPESLRFCSSCYNSELKENKFAIIGRIQNFRNELIGVQRIYLDNYGRKLNVEFPKKILGSYTGGYVEFKGSSSSETIHLAEGIETGLAIFVSLKKTTLCAMNATNLSKVVTDKTVKTIHIWADKDLSGTGQREAEKAAKEYSSQGIKVYLHLPKSDIPAGTKGIDFLDVYVNNKNEIIEERHAGKLFTNEIMPIKMPKYDLPKITDQYLPLVLRDWVFAQANRLNVAPETIVVPLFSILGSLLGTTLAIRPKKNDHWTVYANLWGMIVAPPGTKKSAILNTSIKILNEIENEENKEFSSKMLENISLLEEVGIKISQMNKKFKAAIENDQKEETDALRKEIAELKKQEKKLSITVRRFSTSSFSLEKLIDLLSKNPNGLAIIRDELSGLFESFKKKGQETTRAFLLEGWNGDGTHKYDTISRETIHVNDICLTLLGGTQPSVINKMLADMRQEQSNDGFFQRFQLCVFPNQDLVPGFVDKGLDPILNERIKNVFKKLSKIDGSKFGIKTPESNTYFTKLDERSYMLFVDYMNIIENEVYQAEDGSYKSHINKFSKLFSGLILIFHVIDNIETDRTNHFTLPHVVEMAIRWCDLFKAHAKKLYDTEYNFESLSGFALAKKISEGKVKDLASLRSLHRNGWSNLKSLQEVESASRFLERHNWLKIIEDKPNTGRSSTIIKFNTNLSEFLNLEKWNI